MSVDPGMVQEFATEVAEHIEASEQILVGASVEPPAPGDINLLFRSFHSIKGLSRVIGFGALGHTHEPSRKPQSPPMSSAGDKSHRFSSSLQGGLGGDHDPACEHLESIVTAQSFRVDVAHAAEAQDLFQGTLEVSLAEIGIDPSAHHVGGTPRILGEIQWTEAFFIRIERLLEQRQGTGVVAPIPTHLGQTHAMNPLTGRIQRDESPQKHLQPDRIGDIKGRPLGAVTQQKQVGQLAHEVQVA
jgi:hypothetical protein